jgi:energy-coupling factor transport system ATP-binding protein
MIEIQELEFRNLWIPELSLQEGSIAVIGPNGSGKTTFLRLLAGLTIPDSGTIFIDEKSPGLWPAGFVNEYPDKNALFARVYDELAGPLRFRRVPCEAIPGRVRRVATSAGLEVLLDRDMETLSGGEKAMVAVVAAVIFNPKILILDEFDSHMDPETQAAAEMLLKHSNADYLIRCTQNMDLAARCDTVVALFNGKIKVAGTPEKVFSDLVGSCYYPFSWRLYGATRHG